jgi:hypothetical protein
MDIEGAEYDALLGMERLLINKKPHLILEQSPDDSRCLNYLFDNEYLGINCADYHQIQSIKEFTLGDPIQNIMFIHKSRLDETPYRLPIRKEHICDLTGEDFSKSASGWSSRCLNLQPNRYLFAMDFTADGVDNNCIAGLRLNGEIIFRYNAYSSFLAQSYKKWLVDIPVLGESQIYFEFLNNTRDESMKVTGCEIYCFPDLSPSPWSSLVLD